MRFQSLIKYLIVQAPMAGGISNPALVAAVSNAGGLEFLTAGYKIAAKMREKIKEMSCLESDANQLHKHALVSSRFTGTSVTRAFTGRRARGLTNGFIKKFDDTAPAADPQLHYMIKDIRRAAAQAGKLEYMAL